MISPDDNSIDTPASTPPNPALPTNVFEHTSASCPSSSGIPEVCSVDQQPGGSGQLQPQRTISPSNSLHTDSGCSVGSLGCGGGSSHSGGASVRDSSYRPSAPLEMDNETNSSGIFYFFKRWLCK